MAEEESHNYGITSDPNVALHGVRRMKKPKRMFEFEIGELAAAEHTTAQGCLSPTKGITLLCRHNNFDDDIIMRIFIGFSRFLKLEI
ncbi:uncharacterized protein G2W53_023402 [Senna tora]|uniref:Uncharacterized protein n=1 Tax=Senna tora TaxID=362788 RepID=A0A834TA33_9FABA|nr:uncharacterized protein G2W53_023402 [Senna tora]